MNKIELKAKIDVMEANLNQTMEDLNTPGNRGALQDAMRVVIPIMQEQLEIMNGLYDLLVANNDSLA